MIGQSGFTEADSFPGWLHMFRKGSVCELRGALDPRPGDRIVLPFAATPGGRLGGMIDTFASLFFLFSYNTRAV